MEINYGILLGGSSCDVGNGIAIDNSGNLFITGYTESYGAGSYDVCLLKYDLYGNLFWNRTWGGSGDDIGMGIAVDNTGNIYITGHIYNYGVGGSDVFLLKYDSEGNQLWDTTWGKSGDEQGRGIALDDSGNVYITGYTYSYGVGGSDLFLLKYNSDGNRLWYKIWGGTDDDSGYGIALDDLGNVYITGFTFSYGVGRNDICLLKYNSDGNLFWNRTWGSSGGDIGTGIAPDNSGNIYITGSTDSNKAGNYDVLIIKYDMDGNLLLYEPWILGFYFNPMSKISVDGLENVFIVGSTSGYGTSNVDVFLLKYALDSDGDSLTDNEEFNLGTDPNNSDTDFDGLTDGSEVNIYGTDPSNSDTDFDGLTDESEVNTYGTDPNNPDTDFDGLTDGNEIILIELIRIIQIPISMG